jgi:hypothetical protein
VGEFVAQGQVSSAQQLADYAEVGWPLTSDPIRTAGSARGCLTTGGGPDEDGWA